MSAWKPGVGDPLGHDNPYADGRPNWNLQAKARTKGPVDQLSNNLSVLPTQDSPYKQTFPEKYQWQREETQKGRKHYDHHLQVTEKEVIHRGYGIPDHLVSGNDVPDKKTGRGAPPQALRNNPNDGGVWEPVQRQYPKVSRIEYHSGCKIVDKKPRAETRVDIWPTTLTVRDSFHPGGVKIFPGKRATNKEAFPGVLGYVEPQIKDAQGNMVDYSSVKYGGPFGYKLMHANEKMMLPEGASSTWKIDRTAKYRESPRTQSPALSAAAREVIDGGMSATTRSKPHVPALQLPHGGSFSRASPAPSQLGTSSTAERARSGGLSATTGGGRDYQPAPYTLKGRSQYEQGLVAASNWTFLGSYKP